MRIAFSSLIELTDCSTTERFARIQTMALTSPNGFIACFITDKIRSNTNFHMKMTHFTLIQWTMKKRKLL